MLLCFLSSDEKQQDMSLSISTNGNASITVSMEVNGTIYSGQCEERSLGNTFQNVIILFTLIFITLAV